MTLADKRCEEHLFCGSCIQSNRPLSAGSPVKEVCQWCRHTGACFNSTEHSSGLTPSAIAPSPAICNARCIVKNEAMCPPLDLHCGHKTECTHCTNNSFCSYCDSTEECFNPCGDDAEPPVPEEPLSPPMEPTSEEPDANPAESPDVKYIPLAINPVEETLKSNSKTSTWELATCPSCVWSVPGMCKVAATCRKMKTCGECTTNPGCGWCGSSDGGRCIPAIDKKPCDGEGEGSKCKYWSYGSCEVACNAHSDCGTCTGGNCEWCAGGMFHGRRTSYCTVRNAATQCIASFQDKCPNCTQATNCTSCLKHPHCGYCANTNPAMSKCVEGDPFNGPFDPSDCAASPEHNAGWILTCQAWNNTQPMPAPVQPPHHPPVHPPVHPPPVHPPVEPPISPPVEPPVTVPITPPITPPIAEPTSIPITAPVSPPQSQPPVTAPQSQPLAPSAAPHSTAPSDTESPAKAIEPYRNMLAKRYNLSLIIGSSVAGGIVLFGGLLWVKIHASATHRYRTIGT